jgi:hypothetical protein
MRANLASFKFTLRNAWWRSYPTEKLIEKSLYWRSHYEPPTSREAANLPDHELGRARYNELIDHDPYRYTEYLTVTPEPVIVEPLHGMVIAPGARIARIATDVHRTVRVPPPFPWEYSRACLKKREVPEAILLRHHYGEENYGHFYSDVVSKFMILAREPTLAKVPLLVSRRQFQTKYFQGMVARAGLANRKWIVQDGEAIRVQRLWCAKGLAYTHAWLEFIWDFLKIPAVNPRATCKIYLRRGRGLRRPLRNDAELEAQMKTLGYDAIDPASLSFDEQIALFGNARCVVGSHGSGFFNIAFRRGAPLGLVELFPPGYISTAFFTISQLLGYDYMLAYGTPAGAGEFEFSARQLAEMAAKLEAKL